MKTIIILAAVFTATFFKFCNKNDNQYLSKTNKEFTIEISSSLIKNYKLTAFNDLVINDTAYLTYYSNSLSRYYFISIMDSQLIDSLQISTEFKLSKKEHLEVINKDSIYYLNSKKKLYLLTKNKISCNEINFDIEYMNQIMNYSFTPIEYNNISKSLYANIAYANIVLDNDSSRKEYYNRKFCCEIKLNNRYETKLLNFSYPLNYQEGKNLGINYPQITNANNCIVISFKKSHDFFIYYPLNDSLSVINCKSNYIQHFKIFIDSNLYFIDKVKKYNFEEPAYFPIIYDKYRNVYYRIVKHRSKMENVNSNNENSNYSDWSIIILNKSFEFIGEQKFNGNIWAKHILPVPDGILIPKTNKLKLSSYYKSVKYILFQFEI